MWLICSKEEMGYASLLYWSYLCVYGDTKRTTSLNNILDSALKITTAEELMEFDLGMVEISGTRYTVLTGFEGTGRCFWCGGELKGKLKRYCYGHMILYYRHFEWANARAWCCERQKGLCAVCGVYCGYSLDGQWHSYGHSLEVHHVTPLNGSARYFTAYNLPFNLVGLCHKHHVEAGSALRSPKLNTWKKAVQAGQAIMTFQEGN